MFTSSTQTISLETQDHIDLKNAIQNTRIPEALSVRPRIQKAISEVFPDIDNADVDVPTDVRLMWVIVNNIPGKNMQEYNASLCALSDLLGESELYGGETAWARHMLGRLS